MNLQDNFPPAYQGLLLACLLNDPIAFAQARPVLAVEHFDDELRRYARLILEYYDEHQRPPPARHVVAKCPPGRARKGGLPYFDPAILERPLDPPFPTDELVSNVESFSVYKATENTIFDGYEMLQGNRGDELLERMTKARGLATNATKFRRFTSADYQTYEFPEWLIPGLLFERQVGIMYGRPESLKSYLAVMIGFLLAHGMAWDGRKLHKRRVVYVAAEGSAFMPLRRLAWYKHHGIQPSNDGHDVVQVAVNLLDPTEVRHFIREMQRDCENLGLVIFDTFSACARGADRNSSDVMTTAIGHLHQISTALSCAGVAVAHPGKDEERGIMGSVVQLADVDTVWHIKRPSEQLHVKLTVVKQKDGKKRDFEFGGHEIALGMFDRDGDERTALVMTQGKPDDINEELDDRITIAAVMQPGDDLSLRKLRTKLARRLGGDTQTIDRIKAALTDEWVSVRQGDGVVELRYQIDAGGTRHHVQCR